MWNNVKYGRAAWTLDGGSGSSGGGVVAAAAAMAAAATGNSLTLRWPVWLLGRRYDPGGAEARANFAADFASQCWFTYRRDMPPFPNARGLDTDCGWGCMIRCGQMILASALMRQRLGRFWRWSGPSEDSGQSPSRVSSPSRDEQIHRAILRLFADTPEAPLSIHRLVAVAGDMLNRSPGKQQPLYKCLL